MKIALLACGLLCVIGFPLSAQDPPAPEQCLVPAGARAVTVTHAGKTYRLATDACRLQFLDDPERYSQLYDALAELAAEGTQLTPPAQASLVPS